MKPIPSNSSTNFTIINGEFDLCFGKTKISGKSSFNGYIDMIAFSSSFSNLSKISQLIVYSKAKVAFYKKNQTNQIQDEEISEADKEIIKENNDKISGLNSKKDEIYKDFAKKEDMVRQIIDLALLANNMLKGEALSKFVKRSTSFIK